MAHTSARILRRSVILCPILAASIGCGASNNTGNGTNANGGSLVGGSSSVSSGGTTTNGGSGTSKSSGGTGVVATTSSGSVVGSGGMTGTGVSNSGGHSGATGGAATGGAGTGGRSTIGSSGGQSAAGGASGTGGALGSGGTGKVSSGGSNAGETSAGGATSNTGGTGKGGATSNTGGTGKGGSSSSGTGGVSQGGTNSTNNGGGSAGGSTSSSTAGATSTEATIVPDPSWACGMPDGIPDPTRGTLVFRATLQISDTQNVGTTQYGQRRVLDIKQSAFTGDKVSGTVLTGGFDFELTLSNGVVEVESINMLKASDGTIIYLRTCGVAPAGASQVRIVPDFEVDKSKSIAWLNTGKFAGTRVVNATANTIQFDVYDVSSVTVGEPKVQISKPAGVAKQPWDCSTATGKQGASIFTENVTLGSTLNVGTSDRGGRNVIPITGGTISGSKLTGKIVPGGGDYQFTPNGGSTSLDAKYVLASNDGEFIVVRNCGPSNALIPQFETNASGPYAFMNTGKFMSSPPGGGTSGGVSITFYELN